MQFEPLLDFVLIKQDEDVVKPKKGIALRETVREDRLPATIVAIGPGRVTEYGHTICVRNLKVDDRILFNKNTADQLEEDGLLYLIRGSDIKCKIDDK